jgi:predicted O-methyltransferase YrrM
MTVAKAGSMSRVDAEELVKLLYRHVLQRTPRNEEFSNWVSYAVSGASASDILRKFTNSAEYKKRTRVHSRFPPGHYYSPVVDPATVTNYVERSRKDQLADLHGIDINLKALMRFWSKLLPFIKSTPFTDEKTAANRFYYVNGNYPYADAVVLRAMLGYARPRLVIEIGSGFSSACMLDACGHFELSPFHLTCIDPYPMRLRQLLRESDGDTVDVLEMPVQDVPIELFAQLQENDILFIDSTHVLKTGSDVHYELFKILPQLKPGVLIHFHDIQYPFEYPNRWIVEFNNSWNEIYALRAFLMYNKKFRVVFWHSLLAQLSRTTIQETFPLTLKNAGGSIWLRKHK